MVKAIEAVTMERDEYGCFHETEESVRRRLEVVFGIDADMVTLCEGGFHHGVCTNVGFSVNGVGWYASFPEDDWSKPEIERCETWDADYYDADDFNDSLFPDGEGVDYVVY